MAHDTSQQVTADPVPVTLLVGFLGSGKTTLANRILSEQHDQRIAVIVNEFGDVGIDGQLIVGVDDNVVELSNGCLCCTVQGDLADTLRQLLARRRQTVDAKPFERIVIEASGLASPGPVLQGMLVDPALHAHVHVDGVITMAHAKHIVQQLADHPEASEQVAYADHIILNHCDQCEGDDTGSRGSRPTRLQSARGHRAGHPGSGRRGACAQPADVGFCAGESSARERGRVRRPRP